MNNGNSGLGSAENLLIRLILINQQETRLIKASQHRVDESRLEGWQKVSFFPPNLSQHSQGGLLTWHPSIPIIPLRSRMSNGTEKSAFESSVLSRFFAPFRCPLLPLSRARSYTVLKFLLTREAHQSFFGLLFSISKLICETKHVFLFLLHFFFSVYFKLH